MTAHTSLKASDTFPHTLTPTNFATLFGITTGDLHQECVGLISQHDFRYRRIEGIERDQIVISTLKHIYSGELSVAGDERARGRWEKGWSENLQLFRKTRDLSNLVPKFIRANRPLRLNQDYIMPLEANFELNWYSIFTTWLFQQYLRDVDSIYEFGCGSGLNLAALAKTFPEKRLFGLDWTYKSKELIDEIAKVFGWNLQGRLFDLFSPDEQLMIPENSAVLTIGALEQIGANYERFLQFLLGASPKLCIHIEPIVEWYDENNIIDYLAVLYHRQRNYLRNFSHRLKELEHQGRIEIIKMKRSFFGSLYIEGYSQIIWRPRTKARIPM